MTPPVYTRALHECVSPMAFVVKAYREYMLARGRQEVPCPNPTKKTHGRPKNTHDQRGPQDVADWNSRPQLACTAVQKIRINAGPRGEAFQTIGDYASRGSESVLAGNECAQRNEVTQKQCSKQNKAKTKQTC